MNSTISKELSAERSPPMLEVSHLNVWYGVTEVLRDVSFTVPENKIVSLLGGNGSGKTTVLNTLSGMLTPRAGNIIFQGNEIAGRASDNECVGVSQRERECLRRTTGFRIDGPSLGREQVVARVEELHAHHGGLGPPTSKKTSPEAT